MSVHTLGIKPSSAWTKEFQKVTLSKMSAAGPQALVEILLNMVKSDMLPDAAWLQACTTQSRSLFGVCNAQVGRRRHAHRYYSLF